MDVALLKVLEDRSPTPPPVTGAERRLRDLWLAGLPLERAAAAAGLPVPEAQRRLTAAGFRLAPEPEAVEIEALRKLYIDEGAVDEAEGTGAKKALFPMPSRPPTQSMSRSPPRPCGQDSSTPIPYDGSA